MIQKDLSNATYKYDNVIKIMLQKRNDDQRYEQKKTENIQGFDGAGRLKQHVRQWEASVFDHGNDEGSRDEHQQKQRGDRQRPAGIVY